MASWKCEFEGRTGRFFRCSLTAPVVANWCFEPVEVANISCTVRLLVRSRVPSQKDQDLGVGFKDLDLLALVSESRIPLTSDWLEPLACRGGGPPLTWD